MNAPLRRPEPKVQCLTCGTKRAMEFHCVACCVRWLLSIGRDAIAINAPVIGIVQGEAHLQAVREAYRAAYREQPAKVVRKPPVVPFPRRKI